MSQDIMDAELFADFIIEAREHLETIEPNLLELERAPGNLGLLNEIFRPMHSLKGASGFLGLNRINQLAHRCENILDELRHGSMVVTSAIMDLILASTDALRQMLDTLEESNSDEGTPIENLIEEIDTLMANKDNPVDEESATEDTEPEDTEPEDTEPEDAVSDDSTPEVAEPVVAEHLTSSEEDGGANNATQASASATDATQASNASDNIPDTEAQSNTPSKRESGQLKKINKSPKQWICEFPRKPTYSLTAFGEGHLKDFIDESGEIVENLNSGLLQLEAQPEGQDELINDLFRYFHNLKGNSGIIGYHELNALTHEAETVLNNIRRGEMKATHELIDLLLFVVDIMELLVFEIDAAQGVVEPPDTSEVLKPLQDALAGGPVMLPASMYTLAGDDDDDDDDANDGTDTAKAQENAPDVTEKSTEVVAPAVFAVGVEDDDTELFRLTVAQQMEIIRASMATLQSDSQHKASVDAIYRSLTAIKNACGFVNLPDIKLYAERTAGIVDAARNSDMDFDLVMDLLAQEFEIINDMLQNALKSGAGDLGTNAPNEAAPVPTKAADSAAAPQEPEAVKEPKVDAEPVKAQEQKAVAESKPAPVDVAKEPEKTTPEKAAPEKAAPEKTVAPESKKPAAEKTAPKPAAPAKPAAAPAKPAAAPAKPAAAPAKAPAQASTDAPKGSSTIRVDHEKLDHLMNLIGELIINRNRYTLIARHLEDESAQIDVAQVAQSLSETTYAMARISDDLQDTIMKVRMVPVASVFSRFPRLVRDLSRKSGKEVDLILEGEETELDKSVVEVIGDPLVHLIRNSVDHGVEPQEERLAKGKPPKGRVTLRAYHKGNSVAIEIEDDGKGIDPEKMRQVAIRKKVISAEDAKQLDDREAMELIFAPGFSSAEVITDISGRGVGMDVVRTNIKNLKGSVTITSEIDKGTRFTLLLPLTLAIIDALMVNVADEMFAIPLDAVSETTKIEASLLTDIKGRKAVTLRGEVLGIVELAELLNLPKPEVEPDVLSIVVIHDNERRLGVVVDRLLERQEVVIKPLGSYLGDLKGISGATIMGDGSVILILDPHEVYTMSTSKAAVS